MTRAKIIDPRTIFRAILAIGKWWSVIDQMMNWSQVVDFHEERSKAPHRLMSKNQKPIVREMKCRLVAVQHKTFILNEIGDFVPFSVTFAANLKRHSDS